MIRKPALLKKSIALAVSLFAVLTWAAESASLYCVKKVDDDGDIYIHLSQRASSYTPVQDEQCFEKWYASDGSECAHKAIDEIVEANKDNLIEVWLASNIDFGGYNDQTRLCNQEFYPMEFDVYEPVVMRSAADSPYTISGLCYIAASGPASFGGSLIMALQNVNFEDVHLESPETAGLLGSSLSDAVASYVSVRNVVIRAPIAGLLAGSAEMVNVNTLFGDGVNIYSLPYIAGAESPNLQYVMLGGLVGNTNEVRATAVRIKSLIVSNYPETGEEKQYESMYSAINNSIAYVGGICGAVSEFVQLEHIALEEMMVMDHSSGQPQSYLGGLIGAMHGDNLSVQVTFTTGDIICSRNLCETGFGAGQVTFEGDISTVSVVANYHYSQSTSDVTEGFAGSVYDSTSSNADITNEFNMNGILPGYSEGNNNTLVRANYRNAFGRLEATEGFDSGTYKFNTENQGTLPNGILEDENMKTASFADYLNSLFGTRMYMEPDWQFDSSHDTPYLYFEELGSGNSGGNGTFAGEVFFSLDCIKSGCLTNDEIQEFERFSGGSGNYEVMFPVEADGHIESEWEQFAKSLTGTKKNRDPVCWESSSGLQPFAVGNTYSGYQSYNLVVCDEYTDEEDLTEDTAYVFFGEGIDYYSTPVRLISFDGTSVKDKGDEIDRAEFTGGDAPLRMLPGKVMRIVANNPATTDGSKFKGWVVHAGFANANEGESALRYKAFAGIDVPVDSDGYFDMNGLADTAEALYEKEYMGSANVAEVTAELQKLRQEMMELIQSGKYDDKEFERLSDKADSLEEVMNGTESPDIVVVLAIFPKGFESQNEAREIVEAPDGPDSPELELAAGKSALLQSGNSVQFNVNTNKFVYDGEQPYVNFVVEDADGQKIDEKLVEYESGEWPEIVQWNPNALRPGLYYATAEIFDGSNLKTRQWNFEVKSEIASGCENCWYMVSLANVDFKKFKWNSTEIFYWWNESVLVGKYWQYEEVERKSKIDDTRGYWYNSVLDKPLVLKDSADVNNGEKAVWEVDSVHTGWNMVRNPYGWSVNVSHLERSGLSFFRWVPERGSYDSVAYVRPYESIWVKAPHRMSIVLPSTPAFVDSVDADGNAVPLASLQKSHALAKASGVDDWAVQVSLADANGKADMWNVLGVAAKSRRIEEPPAGMGDYVNLSILEGKTRLAKSVQTANAENAYEWRVELSASRDRRGYLQFKGVESLAQYGLHLYVTVDGETTEITDGEKFAVPLTTSAKIAEVRIAKAAKKVVTYTLQGLRVSQNAGALQVAFDASAGLAGASSRIDIVDVKGKVAATARFNAVDGRNAVELAKPRAGLYVVRVAAGSQVAVQKVLVR